MAFYVCISVDHADFWGSVVWLFFERDFIKKTSSKGLSLAELDHPLQNSSEHLFFSNLKTLAPISLLQRHLFRHPLHLRRPSTSATPSTSVAPPSSFTPSSRSTFSIDTHLHRRSPHLSRDKGMF
ncbi:hypothetical protein HanPSC8_Chr02g0046671 [Helianthus annuus]|nr:hypothetical protein HanPSC8_Chr02g0046671 [Helianthus annuus]